jgi:hypothetical protein
MDWTDPVGQFAAAGAGVAILAGIAWWSEIILDRHVQRIVSTVERDGFYAGKSVEVSMEGKTDVFAVRYARRRHPSRIPRTVIVHGTDKLREELIAGLSG